MPKSLKEKKAEAAAKAAAKVEANEEKKAKLKAKEDAKREKIKADKITKREAAAKGAVTTALKNLAPIAKEINVRFEKAAQMEDDAYDHRLAASLRLKDASDICKKTKGVTFKVWCEENVDQAYGTCTKLVAVGRSDNPKLALEDMRVKNKLANATLRERVAKEKAASAKPKPKGTPGTTTLSKPVVSVGERVTNALNATDKMHAVKIIEAEAERLGIKLASDKPAKAQPVIVGVSGIQELFGHLTGRDKMVVLAWVAEEVGVDLPDSFEVPEANDEDLTDIPDFLKKDTKGKKKSRRKAA